MKKNYTSIGVAFCFLAPILYVLSVGSPGKTNLIASVALFALGLFLAVSGFVKKDAKAVGQKTTNLASSSLMMIGVVLGVVFLVLAIGFIIAWSNV